jgi:hypothetical protein
MVNRRKTDIRRKANNRTQSSTEGIRKLVGRKTAEQEDSTMYDVNRRQKVSKSKAGN